MVIVRKSLLFYYVVDCPEKLSEVPIIISEKEHIIKIVPCNYIHFIAIFLI